jgi:CRP-like cAMP-binding protein
MAGGIVPVLRPDARGPMTESEAGTSDMKTMPSSHNPSTVPPKGLLAGEIALAVDDVGIVDNQPGGDLRKAGRIDSDAERHAPDQNRLLAMLSTETRDRIMPSLEPVSLPLGEVIYEAGGAQRYVYFPADAIVSLLYVMENGESAEISVVGNEGIVGIAAFMGGGNACSRAVVQSPGTAFRLPGRLLKDELHRHGELLRLILRYTQALITQISQTAVCNRHHSIEKQLCRRLLLSLDRLSGDELILTQELIASMLGVRREGVTAAAVQLRKLGVIQYRRGHIKVLDRDMLEQLSCECYAVVKTESDRLLPGKTAMHAH